MPLARVRPATWVCIAAIASVPAQGHAEPTSDDDDSPAAASASEPEPDWVVPAEDDDIFLDPAIAGEAIVVWGERPAKPFDRDTDLRLTRQELERRGATTLAEALDLLPDLVVRAAGRGGRQVEIRGARKGSIKILIDGVPISDPYYGNLDLSAIPITDIEQIRVSSSPASPIDGVGGPGGVVEIHTRDAVGSRLVAARVAGSTLPSSEAAATGRTMLTDRLGLRLSATGMLGARDYQIREEGQRPVELGEDRQQAAGAVRLEYRDGDRRAALDGALETGGYLTPPRADDVTGILLIDDDTRVRTSLTVDDIVRDWRLQGRSYLHYLSRDSRVYDDPELAALVRRERLTARRFGGGVLANRPIGRRAQAITSLVVDTEQVSVVGFDGLPVKGTTTILALAGGTQIELGPVDVDAAVGLAAPFGIEAGFWPEAKLTGTYSPVHGVVLELVTGRKGRLPTLRERFETGVGNEALGPEQVSFVEARSTLRPANDLQLRLASYLRRSSGLIMFDTTRSTLVNSGEFDIRGVEAEMHVAADRPLSGGASWAFTDAHSPTSGGDVLDFLPAHRATVWLTGRHRRAGATARLRAQSSQIDRGTELEARALIEASIWARLPQDLLATLRIDNATDYVYDERTGVRAPGFTATAILQGEWR